ncbi:hypothetical protein D3C75_1060110 [compost metagenome]
MYGTAFALQRCRNGMIEQGREVVRPLHQLAEQRGRTEHIGQVGQIRGGILALGQAQLLDGLVAGDEQDGEIIGFCMGGSG